MSTVKKFHFNHTYDGRVGMQRVPVLRRHSAQIQLVTLKKLTVFRLGRIHRNNSHQTRVDTTLSSSQDQRGKNDSEVLHINDESTPRSFFMLCFAGIVKLLVVKTKRYQHSCMDIINDGSSPQPDTTKTDKFVLLVIATPIENCLREF
jgi:hypothetical protein